MVVEHDIVKQEGIVPIPLDNLERLRRSLARDVGSIKSLVEDIRRRGLLQNLAVRPLGKGNFEVVCGNRRLQALKALDYREAPCAILDIKDDIEIIQTVL